MNARKTVHDTFVIERRYKASPARVFAAWSSAKEKAKWFHGADEKGRDPLELDFCIGGREHASGVAKDGTRHTYDALYLDVVPNERFILTYWMTINDVPISASLQTVELFADGTGTRLKFTEQDAFLDGFDDAGSRREGTEQLLKQLGAALES
jgi:uncharacterized protein YndB with AHSA1/START domain